MKRIEINLLIIILFVLTAVVSFNIYNAIKTPTIVYVDVVRLYNDFELKKQLEGELLASKQKQQGDLDSLATELNYMLAQYEGAKEGEVPDSVLKKYLLTQNTYLKKEQEIENGSTQLASRYDEQIWFQLNEYIKLYGNEHSYDIILGTKGEGEILYGVEAFDITNEMVAFANNKYNGI